MNPRLRKLLDYRHRGKQSHPFLARAVERLRPAEHRTREAHDSHAHIPGGTT